MRHRDTETQSFHRDVSVSFSVSPCLCVASICETAPVDVGRFTPYPNPLPSGARGGRGWENSHLVRTFFPPYSHLFVPDSYPPNSHPRRRNSIAGREIGGKFLERRFSCATHHGTHEM